MKFLHTSDWHLGATLREHPRDYEHDQFLRWLTDVVVEREIDAVLLAGDLFDVANPSHRALALWYGWLEAMNSRAPETRIVVIGGNHDSAARLDGPAGLLRALRIHVVGGMTEETGTDPLLIPLPDRSGSVRAWVGAVPFLGAVSSERVTAVYHQVSAQLRERAAPDHALLLMGHLAVAGERGERVESEREIFGGLENVAVGTFPADIAYVALGHLHRAQAPRANVVYSGSPLPFSFAEQGYEHRVVVVDLQERPGQRPDVAVESVFVPRAVEMQTWPAEGSFTVDAARAQLESLPPPRAAADTLPLVQVRLAATAGASDQRDLEELGLKRDVRLLQIRVDAVARVDGAVARARPLRELEPLDLLVHEWGVKYADEPLPDAVRAAFDLVVSEVHMATP